MLDDIKEFLQSQLGANWRDLTTSEIVAKDAHGLVLRQLLGMLATAEIHAGTEEARNRSEMWTSLAEWSQTRVKEMFAPHTMVGTNDPTVSYDHRIKERSAIWSFVQRFGFDNPPTAVYSAWSIFRDPDTTGATFCLVERLTKSATPIPFIYQVCESGCELQHIHGVYPTGPACVGPPISRHTGEHGRAYVDNLLEAKRAIRA